MHFARTASPHARHQDGACLSLPFSLSRQLTENLTVNKLVSSPIVVNWPPLAALAQASISVMYTEPHSCLLASCRHLAFTPRKSFHCLRSWLHSATQYQCSFLTSHSGALTTICDKHTTVLHSRKRLTRGHNRRKRIASTLAWNEPVASVRCPSLNLAVLHATDGRCYHVLVQSSQK